MAKPKSIATKKFQRRDSMEQELAYSFHLGSDKNKSKLAKKIAKENDIIIKIGQTIFNIFYHQNNFILKLTFYYNLIDQNFYL